MKAPSRPLPLGPFELEAPVARGGMGEVWRGRHIASALPVAIKVITGDQDAAQFRSEVRAAARLTHPHVITVFDQGEVPVNTAAASGGHLEAGLPYLAMEYASGGTLANARCRSFDALSAVMRQILAALAHAHARGVIHRDLKPANVLLAGNDDERPGLKLSDFGIARAMRPGEGQPASRIVVGTLRYMAPEQILGRFRDEGPWTDLYALGAMAYQLATGKPMFGSASGRELAHFHVNVPPPPLRSRAPMPQGLQDWLDRLLAKRPEERFELAADALEALDALGPPRIERISTSPGRPPRRTTAPPTSSIEPAETQIPDHWETGASLPPPPRRLVGAGLGLYGLRPSPMVGRLAERDALWTALGKVVATVRSRAVLLRGSAGTGKSRLCEWLCERAHEDGFARAIRATHSPISSPSDGLAQLVRVALGAHGLSRELVRERALKFITANPLVGDRADYEASALAELAISDDTGNGDRIRFANPEERYQLVRRLCARQARDRPLIVWLDDVHWGGDALRFVASTIGTENAVLFVLTAREDALAQRPDELAQLSNLGEQRRFTVLELPPLSPAESSDLAQQLLGLSGELTREVAERTDGNPLFAVQLVGDWVRRGVLAPGPRGFELAPGASTRIPDDIRDLWISRIAAIGQSATGSGDDDTLERVVVSLEIASALGKSVNQREWRLACELEELDGDDRVIELLKNEGFAAPLSHGWEFVHGTFREALERRARDGGRWPSHHRTAARALATLYSEGRRDVAARRGRHLHAAGDLAEALPHLLAGAEAFRLAGDYALSHALHDERDAALLALGAEREDRRWIEGAIKRAATLQQQGRLEEAIECLSGGAWAAISEKHEDLVAQAETVRGRIHFDMGNPQRSRDAYERSRLLFEKAADREGLVTCLNGLGSVSMWLRELKEATDYLEAARALSRESGDLFELGQTLRNLAHVRHCDRQYEIAAELYQRARGCFEHVGSKLEVANCINDLGELARATGDLKTAESHYREAAAMFASLGAPSLTTATYNLGLVLLSRGDVELARRLFGRQLESIEGKVRSVERLWIEAALLACAARLRDWDAWDAHAAEVESLAESTGFVDEDIADLAVTTGNVTAALGELDRAKRVYTLARHQLEKMDHGDRIAEVSAALEALDRVARPTES